MEDRRQVLRESLRKRVRDVLTSHFDGTSAPPVPEESKARGKDLRERVPREDLGNWVAPADRPDPVALLVSQGKTRVAELLPIRYERMAVSPFTFYRGAALVMASDLSSQSTTGIAVQACGDAHISNFGLYNSPERHTVFDLNDFDETLPGPWEWDIKRLAASVEICGRDNGFAKQERTDAVLACARGYREAMREFATMGNMEVWYAGVNADEMLRGYAEQVPEEGSATKAQKKALRKAEKTITKAKAKDSIRAITKLTEVVDGQLRVVSNPPIVVPLREMDIISFGNVRRDIDFASFMRHLLFEYRMTLAPEKRHLLDQYEVVDVARKVVGVGSVGTRAWIVVMQGASAQDPLVLQVKEAQESVLERFVGKSRQHEHGKRVVEGQRALQASSDVLLGWCRLPDVEGGRLHDYYVRQLWDGKGGIDLATLSANGLAQLARLCGWTLARAHARTGDRFAIAGYLGKGAAFDKAMARFAAAYADQNEADYARFVEAWEAGRL